MRAQPSPTPHPDFPTRAAEVFRNAIGTIEHEGVSVELQPFTIRRVALLHSVQSPLFYPDSKFGAGVGWMLTVFVMGTDAVQSSRLLAHTGVAGFVEEALTWADEMHDYELCAMCALAIKDSWERICRLDPPDVLGDAEAKGAAGNA